MRVKNVFLVRPPDGSRAWKRDEGRVAITEEGDVYVSAAIVGLDHRDAFLRCTYDAVPVIGSGDFALVPASWASKELPSLADAIARLEQYVINQAPLMPASIPSGYCVYVISDGNGHCKIGKAVDVARRLKELQTGNASELRVSTCLVCDSDHESYRAERAAHKILEERRASGEWFLVSERHAEQTLYEAAMKVRVAPRIVQVEFREEAES